MTKPLLGVDKTQAFCNYFFLFFPEIRYRIVGTMDMLWKTKCLSANIFIRIQDRLGF